MIFDTLALAKIKILHTHTQSNFIHRESTSYSTILPIGLTLRKMPPYITNLPVDLPSGKKTGKSAIYKFSNESIGLL